MRRLQRLTAHGPLDDALDPRSRRGLVEPCEQLLVDELLLLGMPRDVRRDEWAQRHHWLPGAPSARQRTSRKLRAKALPLVALVDFGVDEEDAPTSPHVPGETSKLTIDRELKPRSLRCILYDCWLGHRG